MSDRRIHDLLHEVADGVQPGERLDAIRAATEGDGRRGGRGWWTAAGAGLVAASVVSALVLTTGGNAPTSERTPPAPATPAPPTTATDPPTRGGGLSAWVYYVGDTPDGPRLYRERRRTSGENPFSAAEDGLRLAPLDPDYVSLWPADAIRDVSFDGVGDDGVVGVSVDPAYATRPASMSAQEASLAVEQVVRTLQAATRSRAAVQFLVDGNPVNEVLGVPTSEPLAAASDLSVLAHVSLSAPVEGQEVDNDGGLVVDGLANSYEGNVVITVERLDGEVLVEVPTIAGTYEDRLFPFTERLDVVDVPPGDYVVRARTDDPSGEGRFHTDTRTVAVVD